jgi:hypothetical protein
MTDDRTWWQRCKDAEANAENTWWEHYWHKPARAYPHTAAALYWRITGFGVGFDIEKDDGRLSIDVDLGFVGVSLSRVWL